MARVSASFDNVDTAGVAAMRLKSELKTVRKIETHSIGQIADSNNAYEKDYFFRQPSANTKINDYFNFALPYNSYEPFSPRNSQYGYFEPQEKSDTVITAQVDSAEIKRCQSLMRSLGGMKIEISD